MATVSKPVQKSTAGKPIVVGALLFLLILVVILLLGDSEVPVGSGGSLARASASGKSSDCRSLPPSVVIDKSTIARMDTSRRDSLKQFTIENYEKYFMSPPGKEHYALLEYLVKTYGQSKAASSCHVMDIGTRYVASSLALGSHYQNPVWTFDIPKSRERQAAFRGKTEIEWHFNVLKAKVDVSFYNLDLLKVSDADFANYTNTWLISLDTFHRPDTVPFEREFLDRLVRTHSFQGIMILDDIHLNPEMKKWWKEVQDNASNWGYAAHDVTFAGHATGTGLLDFSPNRVVQVRKP